MRTKGIQDFVQEFQEKNSCTRIHGIIFEEKVKRPLSSEIKSVELWRRLAKQQQRQQQKCLYTTRKRAEHIVSSL